MYHYDKRRALARARGEWQSFVDSDPTRTHLESLRAAGLPKTRIAALAGVNIKTVNRALDPHRPRLHHDTAQRLLAVTVPTDPVLGTRPESVVDATGTRRRLQALIALGWSRPALAEHTPRSAEMLGILARARHVEARSALDIRDLYNRLSMTPGPSRRARAEGVQRGWPTPLAWDDHTIDDPDARPVGHPAHEPDTER
ncbi:hypothetical protein ACIRL2_45905 [Embleya sp. NPDC127516]|uniref:hypothetical protein n=1 Tax=Embleya sp. NPDC127516 TaxID=3363990 RepID=UPI003817E388